MVCTEPLTQIKCNENLTKEAGSIRSCNKIPTSPLPLLEVHMDNCRALIQKRPVSLKNALQLKMKNIKLEIENSVAFAKDTNVKIGWECMCDEIQVDKIVIKKIESACTEESVESSTDRLEESKVIKREPDLLRVHIDRYTAVIQKKPVLLKDALQVKLKTRNLEIENSVAFVRDSNVKIGWDCMCDEIPVSSITIRPKSDDIEHNFGKLSISLKTRFCDSCKKKTTLRLRACKKCNYSICDKVECLDESSKLICKSKRRTSLTSSLSIFNFGKNLTSGSMSSETDLSMSFGNWDLMDFSNSQQILPVTEIKPCFSYRMRSSSDSEIKTSPVNDANKDINNNATNNKTATLDSKRLRNKKANAKKSSQRNISIISCEIPMHQIQVEEGEGSQIGKGSFGTVKKAQEFYHGLVAIKFLNLSKPSPNQVTAFRNEMAILKSTRHDNILQYIGCLMKPHLAIVTEFCPGSSLYRHLHQEEEYMEMHDLVDIAKQTAIGMDYLHARGILHRDLKSNNIFLVPRENSPNSPCSYVPSYLSESESQWKVKIGDFGLATVESAKSKHKSNNPSGSILWMAPEVITQKLEDPYSTKSDVYSFAVVVYELVTNQLPFRNKEQNMIFFQVGIGRLKLIRDDETRPIEARAETPLELLELIKTCSKYNRDERLEFDQIGQVLANIRIEPAPVKPKRKRTTSLPNVDKRRYGDLYANYVRQEIENLTAVDQLDEFDLDEDTSVSESDNSNPRFLEFP